MPLRRFLVLFFLQSAFVTACGESRDSPPPKEQSFLIVVNYDLYQDLEESLATYARGLATEGIRAHIEPWEPGTLLELRSLIFTYVDEEEVEGAMLIGSLPAAWYEQDAFGVHEEFPTDIVLQDREAAWLDTDGDGVFDAHTPLELEIYTSRLDGTVDQLLSYFDRAEYHRHVSSLVEARAFVFIDDPWAEYSDRQSRHLNQIYDEVLVMDDTSQTTRDNYVSVLTGDGAEYVYQGMHSGTSYLRFMEEGGSVYCFYGEICEERFKASFLNLFNCSAVRFTEKNLGEAYIAGTGYGLALIGSAKTGAIWDSRVFHKGLSEGRTWGEAYLDWYNQVGVDNDHWHLGIELMGDPLLRPRGNRAPLVPAPSVSPSSPPDDDGTMFEIAKTARLGTFEEYRAAHPEFF